MSSLCVEAKLSQSLNICENAVLTSNKPIILNKKTIDLTDSPARRNLFDTLGVWVQRSRQRKHLAQLDQHLLDDIGLTEEMAAKEVAKPFWK